MQVSVAVVSEVIVLWTLTQSQARVYDHIVLLPSLGDSCSAVPRRDNKALWSPMYGDYSAFSQ